MAQADLAQMGLRFRSVRSVSGRCLESIIVKIDISKISTIF